MAQGAELGRLAPGNRVVVGDRESDIFALFQQQAAQAAAVGLLVRAHAGRQRKVQAGPAARGGGGIRTWVVLLARMAGWRPSERHPLPGNELLWRVNVQLQMMVRFRQATRGP